METLMVQLFSNKFARLLVLTDESAPTYNTITVEQLFLCVFVYSWIPPIILRSSSTSRCLYL